jgi:hypothetical protein
VKGRHEFFRASVRRVVRYPNLRILGNLLQQRAVTTQLVPIGSFVAILVPATEVKSLKWFSVACFLHFSLEPHMECNFLHHPSSPRAFKGQSHYARSNCSSDQAIIPTNKASGSSCSKASASIHIEAGSFCLSPLVTLLPRPWSSIARYRPLSRASGDTTPLGYPEVAVQDSNPIP